jgi:NADH-quinone oxidoreductase subunit I
MSPYTLPDEELVVVHGPEPGGVGGAYRAFGATLKGLRTTFMRLFEKPVTLEYPEQKTPVYPRFRGRHKLHKFEDTGLEKCVGCSLCAAACPADCIFCGYCEVACPFDAITMQQDYELSDYERTDLIFTKEMLLQDPPERTPLRRPGE